MIYYRYDLPNSLTRFIGVNTGEITKTLEEYSKLQKIDIPKKDIFESLDELTIKSGFPLLNEDHFINAKIKLNFNFEINANAFLHVFSFAKKYEENKFGELYGFNSGLTEFGYWFLPKYITQGLKDYDWDIHIDQVENWVNQREKILNQGEKQKHFHKKKKIYCKIST